MKKTDRYIDDTLFSCVVGSNIYKKESEELVVYGQSRVIVSLVDGPEDEKYYLKPVSTSVLNPQTSAHLARIRRSILNPPPRGACYWPVDCIAFDTETTIDIQQKNRTGRDTVEDKSVYAMVFPYDGRPVRALRDLLSPADETDYYCRNVKWSTMKPYIIAFLKQMITLQNEGCSSPMLSDDDIFFVEAGPVTTAIVDCNAFLMRREDDHFSPPDVLLDYEYLDYHYFESHTLDRFSESHSLAAMLFKMCIGILPYASANIGNYYQNQDQLLTWLQNYQTEANQRFVFGRDYPNGNGVGNDYLVDNTVLPKWRGLSEELKQMFEMVLCRENVLRTRGRDVVTAYTAEDWLAAFNRFYNSQGGKTV